MELVDIRDLKSLGIFTVRVQVSLSLPFKLGMNAKMKKSQLSAAIKLAKIIDTLYDLHDASYVIYDRYEEDHGGPLQRDKIENLIQRTYSAIITIARIPHWVVKGHKETEFYVSDYDLDKFFETEPDSAKTIAFLKKMYENQDVREHYENGDYKDFKMKNGKYDV